MHKKPERRYGQRHLHFITCSCYRRRRFLGTPRRRDVLLKILNEVRQIYQFALVRYVVMPEHIHLLISEPQTGTPSAVMQVFKQRISRRFATRNDARVTRTNWRSGTMRRATLPAVSGRVASTISRSGFVLNNALLPSGIGRSQQFCRCLDATSLYPTYRKPFDLIFCSLANQRTSYSNTARSAGLPGTCRVIAKWASINLQSGRSK